MGKSIMTKQKDNKFSIAFDGDEYYIICPQGIIKTCKRKEDISKMLAIALEEVINISKGMIKIEWKF
jgi:hypothetical protein